MIRRIVIAALAVAVLAYGGAAGYMALNQRAFLYRVDASAPDMAASGIAGVEPIALDRPDGVTLHGWHVPPRRPDAPVIVYFHGNAGTLMRRADRFRQLTAGGAGLVAYHYRGYGGSGGRPSEAALAADAAAIFSATQARYRGRPLVLFGESLGSGVATRLAGTAAAQALVLDSPFLSVLDRAQRSYPWLPVSLLLVDTFRSDRAIGAVRMPILILHGARDTVVPIGEGEQLFALASEPKAFARFDEAGHVGAFRFGAIDHIRRFLRQQAGLEL